MAKLIELANKGLRAKIEQIVRGVADDNNLKSHLGNKFVMEDNHVQFSCSSVLGEVLKKTHPKLNFISEEKFKEKKAKKR